MGSFELPTPKLSAFRDEEKRYALENELFEVPYNKSQDLVISVSAASLVQPKYYYELKGATEEAALQDGGVIHFQNLPFGSYDQYRQ